MNTLQLRYEVVRDELTLRPIVDGHDLVAGHSNDQGRDPDDLLPPSSSVLFPTGVGGVALIGVCGCGVAGCGSLSVLVSRIGDEVVWAPVPDPDDETIARTYRFALRQYLDAVDAAAADVPAGEGRRRRVGRAVRVLIEHHEHVNASPPGHIRGTIDWVTGWPWTSDIVKLSLTVDGHQHVHEFTPRPRETEAAFAARIVREIPDLPSVRES